MRAAISHVTRLGYSGLAAGDAGMCPPIRVPDLGTTLSKERFDEVREASRISGSYLICLCRFSSLGGTFCSTQARGRRLSLNQDDFSPRGAWRRRILRLHYR